MNALASRDLAAPRPPMATRRSSGRRPVVVIRSAGAAHGAASRWATELAVALETDVVVVRHVCTRRPHVNLFFPQRHVTEGLTNAAAALRVMEARVRWQRRFADGAAPSLVSLEASGLSSLSEAVRGLDPLLVVVPAALGWSGESVSSLSLELNVPVLVARRRPAHTPVVAASNLVHPTLPVLRQAAGLAGALGRSVTFVHNVEPMVLGWAGDSLAPFALPELEQRVTNFCVERLESAASEHDAGVTVTRQVDPVGGILAAARRAHADLVVVGADPGHDFLSRRVTARVVADPTGSVLVVPLQSDAPASSAEASRTPGSTS
ncbi:MAG: universal stress protein [Myxococcales bacterium]|nr:universal stress protein [Myxococcales bacterium]